MMQMKRLLLFATMAMAAMFSSAFAYATVDATSPALSAYATVYSLDAMPVAMDLIAAADQSVALAGEPGESSYTSAKRESMHTYTDQNGTRAEMQGSARHYVAARRAHAHAYSSTV